MQPSDRGETAGLDPDARFLLANERTLLAWVRTALTLQAGGIGLLQFGTAVGSRGVLGVALLALGAATGVVGFQRYRAADQALRAGRLPPTGRAPEIVALVVVVLATGLAVSYLLVEFV